MECLRSYKSNFSKNKDKKLKIDEKESLGTGEKMEEISADLEKEHELVSEGSEEVRGVQWPGTAERILDVLSV